MHLSPRLRRLGLAVTIAATVLMVVAVTPSTADESWNYSDRGPDLWPELFPECGGEAQTPIDLETKSLHPNVDPYGPSWQGRDGDRIDGRLRINYRSRVTLEVFNNTHTVQANVPEGAGSIAFGGETYQLLQFHFHTPSEHTRDGEPLPIEMHLVHANGDGELAVVGVFIEEGRTNRVLSKFWRDLPDVDESEAMEVERFQLAKLTPRLPRGLNYTGSLTTPPCTEGVNWFVLDRTYQMSERQIGAFQDIFSGEEFPAGNARPVQPLNDRPVVPFGPRFRP